MRRSTLKKVALSLLYLLGPAALLAAADEAELKYFTLLYEGPSGLEPDPGRNTAGKTVKFDNKAAYKTYRILVTSTRGTSDSTQYAELKLLGKTGP